MGRPEGEKGTAVSSDDESSAPENEATWAPFTPEGTIPDKPPPSRSYAPESLTPFKLVQTVSSLPEPKPDRRWLTPVLSLGLAAGLVFIIAAIIIWVSAG